MVKELYMRVCVRVSAFFLSPESGSYVHKQTFRLM